MRSEDQSLAGSPVERHPGINSLTGLISVQLNAEGYEARSFSQSKWGRCHDVQLLQDFLALWCCLYFIYFVCAH